MPQKTKIELPKIPQGHVRKFCLCKTCGMPMTYDFVPYSLSTAIHDLPCGHGITQRLYEAVKDVDEETFMISLKAYQEKRALEKKAKA
jgi:hypothetical protein